jgi:hypothetical protein
MRRIWFTPPETRCIACGIPILDVKARRVDYFRRDGVMTLGWAHMLCPASAALHHEPQTVPTWGTTCLRCGKDASEHASSHLAGVPA